MRKLAVAIALTALLALSGSATADERSAPQVMAAPVLHTGDTPIAVLAPGNGRTRTGRLWTYVVDERPW